MRFYIATVLYPKAEPYFEAFFNALKTATKNHSVTFLIVNDGVKNAAESVKQVGGIEPLEWLEVEPGHTPAAIRGLLFEKLRTLDFDTVVFADCDDALLPDALAQYETALKSADFAFGDQELMNTSGLPLNQNLFSKWNVPETLQDPRQLFAGNFVGFSAVAMTRKCLLALPRHIPADLIAIDWWVFTMALFQKMRGQKTQKPVVRYRQHLANTYAESLNKRIDTVRTHFKHLPDLPEVLAIRKQLSKLPAQIATERPDFFDSLWYGEVIQLAEKAENQCTS